MTYARETAPGEARTPDVQNIYRNAYNAAVTGDGGVHPHNAAMRAVEEAVRAALSEDGQPPAPTLKPVYRTAAEVKGMVMYDVTAWYSGHAASEICLAVKEAALRSVGPTPCPDCGGSGRKECDVGVFRSLPCHCKAGDPTPAVERPTEPSEEHWPELLRLQVIAILRQANVWHSALAPVLAMEKIEAAVLRAGAPQEEGERP